MNPFCPKMLLGVGRSPLFAQQPSRRSWLSRGWLICVDGGVDERGGSRTLPCVRASTKFEGLDFKGQFMCVGGGMDKHDGSPWRVTFFQVGAGVANHPTLHHRFHVVTGCHCAVLLNKDTFERDVTTKPIMVPAKKMCRMRSWGHSRDRPIQEASWRWLSLLFHPERPRQLCVWCPSINLFQFAVVDTQLVRPLANLARTPRKGSSANPLPCRLHSAHIVAFVWQPFRSREHEVCRILWPCQLPHTTREWLIKRMDPTAMGVKKTDQSYHLDQWVHMQHVRSKGTKNDRRRLRSSHEAQSRSWRWGESWFVSSILLSLNSLRPRPSVPYAGHRRLFPRVVSATVDIADMLSDVGSPRDAASEILFCPS